MNEMDKMELKIQFEEIARELLANGVELKELLIILYSITDDQEN